MYIHIFVHLTKTKEEEEKREGGIELNETELFNELHVNTFNFGFVSCLQVKISQNLSRLILIIDPYELVIL